MDQEKNSYWIRVIPKPDDSVLPYKKQKVREESDRQMETEIRGIWLKSRKDGGFCVTTRC